MAVNFYNSAGTDLDSLFFTDNSNAGSIGFLTSDGQDLGNRYSALVTLGTNIGYKNLAGTDIGYLRGKLAAPTGTLTATKGGASSGYSEDSGTSCDSNGENCSSYTDYSEWSKGYVTASFATSNGMPATSITYTAQVRIATAQNYNTILDVNTNSTTPTTAGNAYNSSVKLTTSWMDAGTWTTNGSVGNVAFYFDQGVWYGSKTAWPWRVRIKAVVSNNAGSNTIYSSEVSF